MSFGTEGWGEYLTVSPSQPVSWGCSLESFWARSCLPCTINMELYGFLKRLCKQETVE